MSQEEKFTNKRKRVQRSEEDIKKDEGFYEEYFGVNTSSDEEFEAKQNNLQGIHDDEEQLDSESLKGYRKSQDSQKDAIMINDDSGHRSINSSQMNFQTKFQLYRGNLQKFPFVRGHHWILDLSKLDRVDDTSYVKYQDPYTYQNKSDLLNRDYFGCAIKRRPDFPEQQKNVAEVKLWEYEDEKWELSVCIQDLKYLKKHITQYVKKNEFDDELIKKIEKIQKRVQSYSDKLNSKFQLSLETTSLQFIAKNLRSQNIPEDLLQNPTQLCAQILSLIEETSQKAIQRQEKYIEKWKKIDNEYYYCALDQQTYNIQNNDLNKFSQTFLSRINSDKLTSMGENPSELFHFFSPYTRQLYKIKNFQDDYKKYVEKNQDVLPPLFILKVKNLKYLEKAFQLVENNILLQISGEQQKDYIIAMLNKIAFFLFNVNTRYATKKFDYEIQQKQIKDLLEKTKNKINHTNIEQLEIYLKSLDLDSKISEFQSQNQAVNLIEVKVPPLEHNFDEDHLIKDKEAQQLQDEYFFPIIKYYTKECTFDQAIEIPIVEEEDPNYQVKQQALEVKSQDSKQDNAIEINSEKSDQKEEQKKNNTQIKENEKVNKKQQKVEIEIISKTIKSVQKRVVFGQDVFYYLIFFIYSLEQKIENIYENLDKVGEVDSYFQLNIENILGQQLTLEELVSLLIEMASINQIKDVYYDRIVKVFGKQMVEYFSNISYLSKQCRSLIETLDRSQISYDIHKIWEKSLDQSEQYNYYIETLKQSFQKKIYRHMTQQEQETSCISRVSFDDENNIIYLHYFPTKFLNLQLSTLDLERQRYLIENPLQSMSGSSSRSFTEDQTQQESSSLISDSSSLKQKNNEVLCISDEEGEQSQKKPIQQQKPQVQQNKQNNQIIISSDEEGSQPSKKVKLD